jgi:hypothetical protein
MKKEKVYENIQDMASGQESGVVIYPGGEVFIINWSGLSGNELPQISPFGLIAIGKEPLTVVDQYRCEDIKSEFPGDVWKIEGSDDEYDTDMDVTLVNQDDLLGIFGFLPDWEDHTSGNVFVLDDDTKVIAPHGWN